MYAIDTKTETLSVTADGLIGRPAIGMRPSGQWRVIGAVRRNNFGHRVEYRSFPNCMSITDWRHKNGSPRWHLRDLDHGTVREWAGGANAVRRTYPAR